MDWQLRIALIIGGIILVGYIYFDFTKKKKTHKDNERLKRKFKGITEQVDGAGFDFNGVGSARPATSDNESATKGSSIEQFIRDREEPVFEDNSMLEKRVEENIVDEKHRPENEEQVNSDNDLLTENKQNDQPQEKTVRQDTQQTEQPQRALVLSLILQASQGHTYKGKDFLPIFLSQGLRHGDMGIFHRRQRAGADPGAVLFSLANGIAPGIFELNNLEAFETPVLALFTTLPGPDDPQIAYDAMVKTIRLLKTELGGEVLDETKSIYTEQTHNYRLDQIQEFCRTTL